LNAINAQRETFQDENNVRIHGIIVNGGDTVNIIPDKIEMEVQIRARNITAIQDAAAKIDRSVCAGAMAMGAAVEIETIPGYMPLRNNDYIADLYWQNLKMLNPDAHMRKSGHRQSSTDMGDLSCIIPVLHAYSPGAEGDFHSIGFRISDPEKACLEPAKLMAMTAIDLLKTEEIPSDYKFMCKERYLETLKAFALKKQFNYRKLHLSGGPL
jgi:metal-dependent amidase/aminoacylase/carboxypeptidase family protein